MPDLQTVLTMLENRLLKAEGRIAGLTGLLQTLVLMQAVPTEKFREHVTALRDEFDVALNDTIPKDRPYVQAARDVIVEFLSNLAEKPAVTFSVIDGGKKAD